MDMIRFSGAKIKREMQKPKKSLRPPPAAQAIEFPVRGDA
jgi:hypothetical protein